MVRSIKDVIIQYVLNDYFLIDRNLNAQDFCTWFHGKYIYIRYAEFVKSQISLSRSNNC